MKELQEEVLFSFIIGDFEWAWRAVSGLTGTGISRGNFLFARSALLLLEIISRICASDKTGKALSEFSSALDSQDPRYFLELPGQVMGRSTEYTLPSRNGTPEKEMIGCIFDLIRNGHAHQGVQISASLSDGSLLGFSITGADNGTSVEKISGSERINHLSISNKRKDEIWVMFHPNVMFYDLRSAILISDLLRLGLNIDFLTRPRANSNYYNFSAEEMRKALS